MSLCLEPRSRTASYHGGIGQVVSDLERRRERNLAVFEQFLPVFGHRSSVLLVEWALIGQEAGANEDIANETTNLVLEIFALLDPPQSLLFQASDEGASSVDLSPGLVSLVDQGLLIGQ